MRRFAGAGDGGFHPGGLSRGAQGRSGGQGRRFHVERPGLSGAAVWCRFPGSPPLPLLYVNLMAETAIAYLGRGRIVNPPKYTARDWHVPAGAHA